MSNIVFNVAKTGFGDGSVDWDTSTIKVALAGTDCATPTGTETTLAAVFATAAWEIDGTGYTRGYGGAGRTTLGSMVVSTDQTNARAKLVAADVTWDQSGSGINAGQVKAAVVYKHTGGADSSCVPIAWIDQGGFPIPTNGGSLKIKWAENTGTEGIVIQFTN